MNARVSLVRRLLTFGAVGLGATIGYIAVSTVLVGMGYRPWIVSPLVYAALIPVAYMGQRTLTFRSKTNHTSSLPRYLVIQGVGLVLAALIPAVVSEIVSPAGSFVVVSGIVAATNYILLARWAFPASGEVV
jgi:putative flippase GtrA